MGNCPAGTVKAGGFCYAPCKSGYNSEACFPADHCSADCAPGKPSDLLGCHHCDKDTYPSSGSADLICNPNGGFPDLINATCYQSCPSGTVHGDDPNLCIPPNCPEGMRKSGDICFWPDNILRAPHASHQRCLDSSDGKQFGCQKCGLLWYASCPTNFAMGLCGTCEWAAGCPFPWEPREIGSCQPQEITVNSDGPPNTCPPDFPVFEQEDGKCHPQCKPGYTRGSIRVDTCESNCPVNTTDDGTGGCTRDSYPRGKGTLPEGAEDFFKHFWWVLVIIGVVILLLILSTILTVVKTVV